MSYMRKLSTAATTAILPQSGKTQLFTNYNIGIRTYVVHICPRLCHGGGGNGARFKHRHFHNIAAGENADFFLTWTNKKGRILAQ